MSVQGNVLNYAADFNSTEINSLLSEKSLSFEEKRLISIYLFLTESNSLRPIQILTDMLEEHEDKVSLHNTLFMFFLANKNMKMAEKYLANMPSSHHKNLFERILDLYKIDPGRSFSPRPQANCKSEILSVVNSLVTSQDWPNLYIYCNFIIVDLKILHVGGTLLKPYLAYAMLRMNLKHGLTVEVKKAESSDFTFEWMSLKSYILFFDNDFEEIYEQFRDIMPQRCGEFDAFYSLSFECYAEALLRTGRKEALNLLVEQDILLNGSRSWNALYSGLSAFATDMDRGIQIWRDGTSDNNFCINHSWGVNSFGGANCFRFPSQDLVYLGKRPEASDSRLMVVSCADAKYAKQFSPVILKNITSNPEIRWHYHFMLVQGAQIDNLISLLDRFENVSMSYEVHGRAPPKAYYTITRFNVGLRLLSDFKTRMIISDVDMEAIDLVKAQKIALNDKHKVGLRYIGFYHHFPWHSIQANIIYLDGSDYCKIFLADMVQWFEENFDYNHRYQWWIDQVAISVCAKRRDSEGFISSIEGDFVKCFRFAGSSPDRKDKYIKSILEENKNIHHLVSSILEL